MVSRSSRRRFLGSLGAAGLVGTAGCLRRLQDATTSVDYPEPRSPSYRRWLPAPAALPGEDDGYDASHLRMTDLRANDELPRAGTGLRNLLSRTGRDPLGVDPAQVESVAKMDLVAATILFGSFEVEAVTEAAVRAGYEETATDGDFTLYERSNQPYAAAVSEDVLVQSRHDEAASVARRVVGAGRGETDRYHEVDDGFDRLSETIGGTVSWIHPDGSFDTPEGAIRSATGQQVVGDRAFFARVYLFGDASAASAEKVRSAVADEGNLPRTTPLDIAVDGRVGRAEYARDVENVFDGDRELQPIVAWGFDYRSAVEELTVTHRAGDEVVAERLTLRTEDGPADRQFEDEYDSVGPSDSVTVSLSPDVRLRVVWELEQSTSTLSTYRSDAEESTPT